MSMSTVFSSASPISQDLDTHENSTLAAFVAHIERLQDQVREKDVYITELEEDREQLRQRLNQLEQEHNEIALQSDIQNQLLRKTQRTDSYIERLRTAIIDRESIIGEKEKTIHAVERQLEYHKLLLQAEIRRHAAMKLHVAAEDDPLPDLSTLARREDIDRWVSKLNERLKRAQSGSEGVSTDAPEAQVESLRQEIDFYVREIIFFKLDIKGYKSDIRKLKRITAQLSSYGRTSDVDSEASSLRPVTTPVRSRFASATPELGDSNTTSPVLNGPVIASASIERPVFSSPSVPAPSLNYTITDSANSIGGGISHQLGLNIPTMPQTPMHEDGLNVANEIDRNDSGISSRSVAPQSPEHRKPTVCAPAVVAILGSNYALASVTQQRECCGSND
jgi:hypothetical protein